MSSMLSKSLLQAVECDNPIAFWIFLSYNCFEILPTVIIEICDSIVIAALVAFEFGEAQPRDCNRSKLIELHKRWDS